MSYQLILPFFPEELRELLLDPSISDLMINGTTGFYADRKGVVQHIPLKTPYTNYRLQAAIERVARIHGTDLGRWNAAENSYDLDTGSRIYCYGLKTVSADADVRYKKIRGLSVSRIYIDQAEELPADIASELRFPLRPDITARASGRMYPTQLTFSPNPPDTHHWLAKQFPIDNRFAGRKYYGLSIYDNQHNLPADQLAALEREFPSEHPRHRTLILGQRGPNVTGAAIFDNLYDRRIHRRPLPLRVRELASLAGMVILVALMAVAFKNDIERRRDVIQSQIKELVG